MVAYLQPAEGRTFTDAEAEAYMMRVRDHFMRFDPAYDDRIPETYFFQVQYKDADGDISGWRNVVPQYRGLDPNFETEADNVYRFSYSPGNTTVTYVQLGDPSETFQDPVPSDDPHLQNFQAANGSNAVQVSTAVFESYPMLFLTLPLDTNRYIGFTGNISAMIPYPDERDDSVGFIYATREPTYLLGANHNAARNSDIQLIRVQDDKFGPIADAMSDITGRVSSFPLLTPGLVHQASVSTQLARVVVAVGDLNVDWITVYHVSGNDYIIYPAAPVIFSFVVLPFLLLFMVFVPLICVHRLLLRPLSKIVNQLITIQTEAIDAIDVGHYSRITELKRTQLALYDLVGYFTLYKGFIPAHVQNKLNEEYGLYSEDEDDEDEQTEMVVPYEAGNDLRNLKSFRHSLPGSSFRDAPSTSVLDSSGHLAVTMPPRSDHAHNDPGALPTSSSLYSASMLSRKSTTYSIGSKRSAVLGTSVDASERNRIFEIGLYPTEGTVLVIHISNLRKILDLKAQEIFVMQYGKLIAEIQYLLQTARGDVSQFTIQQIVVVWTEQWKNHHARACNFARRLIEKIDALNHESAAQGVPIRLKVFIGISTGDISTGNIGRESMKTSTVVGDTTDIAVCLSRTAEQMKVDVMVDHQVYMKVGRQQFLTRPISLFLDVPLRTNPALTSIKIPTFELGERIEMSNQEWLYTLTTQELLAQYDIYNTAMDSLKDKNFSDAANRFRHFLSQNPNDIPAQTNLDYCLKKAEREMEDVMISATPFVVEKDFLEKDSEKRNSMRRTSSSSDSRKNALGAEPIIEAEPGTTPTAEDEVFEENGNSVVPDDGGENDAADGAPNGDMNQAQQNE